MASLADVFRVVAQMRDEGLVTDYAIGGATAVLSYAEPTRTYDVDVFALLPSVGQSLLVSLAPIYRWADSQGFTVDAEHVFVHGVPVQILPAYNALVIDAIHVARVHEYQGIPVRVVDPEHLTSASGPPAPAPSMGAAVGRHALTRHAPHGSASSALDETFRKTPVV